MHQAIIVDFFLKADNKIQYDLDNRFKLAQKNIAMIDSSVTKLLKIFR